MGTNKNTTPDRNGSSNAVLKQVILVARSLFCRDHFIHFDNLMHNFIVQDRQLKKWGGLVV